MLFRSGAGRRLARVVNRPAAESVLRWGTAATTAGAVASTHGFQDGRGRDGG